jgi:hypothetical protein
LEVYIRYIIIVLSAFLFLLLYVWQNVEVTKIKMEYQKALEQEKELIKKNDKLRYEIERYRRMELVEQHAFKLGMRELDYNDFEAIIINRK